MTGIAIIQYLRMHASIQVQDAKAHSIIDVSYIIHYILCQACHVVKRTSDLAEHGQDWSSDNQWTGPIEVTHSSLMTSISFTTLSYHHNCLCILRESICRGSACSLSVA